jgi:hypothetical protein
VEVGRYSDKPDGAEKPDNVCEPCPRCLPKSIQRLGEQTDRVRLRGVDEPDWLLAEHPLVEMSMEKCVRHIKSEYGSGCGWLHHESKCLAKVDAWALCEAAHDSSWLVSLEAAVGMKFVLQDPFAGDDVGAGWARNKAPGVVRLEGIEFPLYRSSPLRVMQSRSDGAG